MNLLLNGRPRSSEWIPIRVELIHEDEGRELSRSDAPWLGSNALILRVEAVRKMRDLLEECGELLPLECAEAELWVYNPICVLPALDEAASSITRFRDGRIMMVDRYVLRPDVIGDTAVFKLAELEGSETFVSARFVERWKGEGLSGLNFLQIWAPN